MLTRVGGIGAVGATRRRRSLPAALAKRLAALGDSITDGTGVTPYSDAYAASRPSVTYQKFAQGGRVLGAPGDTNATNSLYGHLAEVAAFAPAAMTILIGANDLNGTSDAGEYLTRLQAFVAAAKAAIPSLQWVGICTMLPYSTSLANNSALFGNIPAVRLAYNNGVRAGEGVWHDRAIQLGDHPVTATDTAPGNYPSYSAFYQDGLHPSTPAINNMTAQYTAVMDGVFGFTTAANPVGFAMPDVTEAALSTVYTSEGILAGMSDGARVPVSKSGAGDFRVGLGSFGTSAVTNRRNGDVVQGRQTSSAANNTLTSATYNAGTASDPFDVTTIAVGPPTVAFDPATKTAGATLSNNNRTMAGAYGGDNHYAYSTSAKGIGSKVAFTIGSPATITNALGMTTAAGGGTNKLLLVNNGYTEVNGAQESNFGYVAGDVIELELVANVGDPAKVDVMGRKNGGAQRRFVTAITGTVFFFANTTDQTPTITISDYTHWE